MSTGETVRVSLVLRPGQKNDWAAKLIKQIDRRCFPEDPPVELEDSWWWLLFVNNRAVGFAGLKRCPHPKEQDIGFLSRAGILKTGRGKGYQKKLIAARVRYAKQLEMRAAISYTVKDNWPSLTNLIRAGFRFYGPDYPWAGKDKFYFWIDL